MFSTLHFKLSSPSLHAHSLSHPHSSLHQHMHKPETIYTADFQIVVTATQLANPDSNMDPYPVLSLLLPKSQSNPTLATPTREPTSATTVYPEPIWDDNTVTGHDGKGQKRTQAKVQNGSRSRGTMEQGRFKLLFVLWPTLVGLSMVI